MHGAEPTPDQVVASALRTLRERTGETRGAVRRRHEAARRLEAAVETAPATVPPRVDALEAALETVFEAEGGPTATATDEAVGRRRQETRRTLARVVESVAGVVVSPALADCVATVLDAADPTVVRTGLRAARETLSAAADVDRPTIVESAVVGLALSAHLDSDLTDVSTMAGSLLVSLVDHQPRAVEGLVGAVADAVDPDGGDVSVGALYALDRVADERPAVVADHLAPVGRVLELVADSDEWPTGVTAAATRILACVAETDPDAALDHLDSLVTTLHTHRSERVQVPAALAVADVARERPAAVVERDALDAVESALAWALTVDETALLARVTDRLEHLPAPAPPADADATAPTAATDDGDADAGDVSGPGADPPDQPLVEPALLTALSVARHRPAAVQPHVPVVARALDHAERAIVTRDGLLALAHVAEVAPDAVLAVADYVDAVVTGRDTTASDHRPLDTAVAGVALRLYSVLAERRPTAMAAHADAVRAALDRAEGLDWVAEAEPLHRLADRADDADLVAAVAHRTTAAHRVETASTDAETPAPSPASEAADRDRADGRAPLLEQTTRPHWLRLGMTLLTARDGRPARPRDVVAALPAFTGGVGRAAAAPEARSRPAADAHRRGWPTAGPTAASARDCVSVVRAVADVAPAAVAAEADTLFRALGQVSDPVTGYRLLQTVRDVLLDQPVDPRPHVATVTDAVRRFDTPETWVLGATLVTVALSEDDHARPETVDTVGATDGDPGETAPPMDAVSAEEWVPPLVAAVESLATEGSSLASTTGERLLVDNGLSALAVLAHERPSAVADHLDTVVAVATGETVTTVDGLRSAVKLLHPVAVRTPDRADPWLARVLAAAEDDHEAMAQGVLGNGIGDFVDYSVALAEVAAVTRRVEVARRALAALWAPTRVWLGSHGDAEPRAGALLDHVVRAASRALDRFEDDEVAGRALALLGAVGWSYPGQVSETAVLDAMRAHESPRVRALGVEALQGQFVPGPDATAEDTGVAELGAVVADTPDPEVLAEGARLLARMTAAGVEGAVDFAPAVGRTVHETEAPLSTLEHVAQTVTASTTDYTAFLAPLLAGALTAADRTTGGTGNTARSDECALVTGFLGATLDGTEPPEAVGAAADALGVTGSVVGAPAPTDPVEDDRGSERDGDADRGPDREPGGRPRTAPRDAADETPARSGDATPADGTDGRG